MKVEHENRSVVVFADHFTVPYNHLIKKISDEKAGLPGCLFVDLGCLARVMHSSAAP